jgi:hypothetical protein
MKKSSPASGSASSCQQQVERLTDVVGRLADEVRVVRDVLDDIREDLSWITRNGVPTRSIEHTRVIRIARDPLAPDARDHLELRTYTLEPHGSSEISPKVFDELVSEIAEAVTVIGQEQLNMFLMAIDDARAKLLAAIKATPPQPTERETNASSEPPQAAQRAVAVTEVPERGRLF